jgi:arginyl-tRNA synthetase
VKKILEARERTLSDNDTKAVALGAIIYSFLSQDRERDLVFEWDKVLAFEGNSGPYLQYTYVRWKKILDEIGPVQTIEHQSLDIGLTPFDRDVVTDIMGFNEVFENCGTTYKFHLLIAHLATMTRHLNALYANTPKLKETIENERIARIKIIQNSLKIIQYTANIIGMPLPEEM